VKWHCIVTRGAYVLVLALLVQNGCTLVSSNSAAPAAEGNGGLSSGAHDLTSRFEHLSCAVVHITSDAGGGTGFFTDNKGTLVTAAHVVFDQKYVLPLPATSPAQMGLTANNELTPRKGLTVQVANGIKTPLSVGDLGPLGKQRASYDLALISTNLRAPCFIPIAPPPLKLSVGQHLIAIGVPGAAVGQVLYDGFLSAISIHPPLPVGTVEGRPDTPVFAKYYLLRVQMPITQGLSGSPVISDSDEVVGLISGEPVIGSREVSEIARRFGGMRNVSSETSTAGFDLPKIVGQLAWIMMNFESPGAGFAVPSVYLNSSPVAVQASPTVPSATATPSVVSLPFQ